MKKNTFVVKFFFFFTTFIYLFISFKLNIFSFENFITPYTVNSSYDVRNFTFVDVVIYEKKFFEENFKFHFLNNNNFFLSIYNTRFFNYHIIKIINFFFTKTDSYIYYFNFIILLNIFFFALICTLIANKIIINNNYIIPILFITLVSWTPGFYIYLRSVTLFPLVTLCSLFSIFFLYFNFNIFKYLLCSGILFFIILFHGPQMFFIYCSILSFPFIYYYQRNKSNLINTNILYNYKIVIYYIFSIILPMLIYIFINFFILNIFNINFIHERVFPKLIYYLTAFNKCDNFFICYLNGLLGNIRYIIDTYYTFIPFYHTGHNPWDLTIAKEIRIISPLMAVILIIFFIRINKDFISRLLFKFCLLSFVFFLIYYMLFPFQIIAYEYTPYWILFPFYGCFLVYLSYIIGSKLKKHQNKFLFFFIFLFIFSIYRYSTLSESKFLNIAF